MRGPQLEDVLAEVFSVDTYGHSHITLTRRLYSLRKFKLTPSMEKCQVERYSGESTTSPMIKQISLVFQSSMESFGDISLESLPAVGQRIPFCSSLDDRDHGFGGPSLLERGRQSR
jgi:hypothetical protein